MIGAHGVYAVGGIAASWHCRLAKFMVAAHVHSLFVICEGSRKE